MFNWLDGDLLAEDAMKKCNKAGKITLILFCILTIPAILLPTPETVVMMFGVEKLKELNADANVSSTQLYKDITTIIHNYAVEKKKN